MKNRHLSFGRSVWIMIAVLATMLTLSACKLVQSPSDSDTVTYVTTDHGIYLPDATQTAVETTAETTAEATAETAVSTDIDTTTVEQSETETVTESASDTAPSTEPETEFSTENAPVTESETETETETETEIEVETETQPEPTTESEPEITLPTETETESAAEPETNPPVETAPVTEVETDTETEAETETELETESEAETATAVETEVDTSPDTEPHSEIESEQVTEPETDTVSESETEPATEAETEPETESETESETETVPETDSEFETESETEPESESESESETITPEVFDDPDRYDSDYFYNFLATKSNGDSLQSYYRLLDASLTAFHSSDVTAQSITLQSGEIYYYIDKFNFANLGLTYDEAASVRALYVYDHPLYYWIYNGYLYDSTSIYICVDAEYATGEAREYYNALVYEGVAAMAQGLNAETSPYNIALAYYERLLAKADYAYEEDGSTPQDDIWAHNIIGVFDPAHYEVVCEGFAEAYALLLNFHGVENLLVPGTSGGTGHIWNLLQLDNGEWYWCDITWDDTTYSPLGTDFKYFCVTDTQNVLYYYYRDGSDYGMGGFFGQSMTFMEDHTILWDIHVPMDMTGALPARAQTAFDGDVLTLRETFTVDGMTYILTGYGKVQLTSVGSNTQIIIPETVTYNGVTYTVTSIGRINSDGVYLTGNLLSRNTTATVYVPKTVSYVWNNALSGLRLTVTVDPENPYYTSQNGTLKER